MTPLKDPITRDVVELFRELLHALLMSSMPAWLDLQLTVPQLRTLFIIAHGQSSSVAQIAEQLGIGGPTASHLVNKLVEAGLVERAEDPDDRRRTRVSLAPAGEALIGRLVGCEHLVGGWLRGASAADVAHLQKGLHSIVAEIRRRPQA